VSTYEQDAAEVKAIVWQMSPLVERIDRVLTDNWAKVRAEQDAMSYVAGKAPDQVGNSHST
jgi:hypothetical protein